MAGLIEAKSDLRIGCPADLLEVRQALQQVRHFLSMQDLPCDLVEDVDLVLAEAMTNIVRHSYKDAAGLIECHLVLGDVSVECRLTDTGNGFDPAGAGHRAPSPSSFSEGGYGWFLIRSLTQRLSYAREGNRNVLCFSLDRRA